MALALVVALFTALMGAPLSGAADAVAAEAEDAAAPDVSRNHDRTTDQCRVDSLGVLHEAVDERLTSPDLATHASIPLPEGTESVDDYERHTRALVLLAFVRCVHVEAEVLAPRESETSTPRHVSVDIRSLRGPPKA